MTDLFSWQPPPLPQPNRARAFDGTTYDPREDHKRLNGQLLDVFKLMSDGQWRTLADISSVVEGSEASISARLRDLRKPKYGARSVERERIEGGLYRYRIKGQG
jgi:hypothetical protein